MGVRVALVAGHDRLPAVDLLGPGVLLALGEAERLGGVAHRHPRAVADDVGDLRGVAAAVGVVDPLDHLLAAVGVEVDVDVGLLVAVRGDEPLEGQSVEDGVDGGDAEGVADRGARGGAAALAQDPPGAGEGDDVVDDDEVAGEVLLGDDAQLVLEPLAGLGLVGDAGVPLGEAALGQHPQPRVGGVPLGDLPLGQRGGGLAQVEGQLVGERDAAGDGAGVGRQRGRHLGAAAQVGRAGQVEPAVEVGQAAAGADRRHRRGQPAPPRGGVVDVAGRDDVEAVDGRQPGESSVGRVGPGARRELDEDVLEPEERRQPVERLGRGGSPPVARACRTLPLRHPVSTTQWPRPRSPSSSRS